MQISQNGAYNPSIPSCRNYDLTQVRNKFNEILSNFRHNIHEIKNQVTIAKPKVNSVKHKNFTIWLDSFENFLSELEDQIMKIIIDVGYEIDCSKINEWINNFVTTLLEKELPQNITNNLEYDFQHNLNNNLNQSISQTKNVMNDLKKNIENNNVESSRNINSENQKENIEPCQSIESISINQSFVDILKNFENFLLQIEQAKTFIPEKNRSINFDYIINQLDILLNKFNTEKQRFFSNLKTADQIQFNKWSVRIENIYSNTIQQVNFLKDNIIILYNNYSYEISKSQNTNNVEIVAYNQFIEYTGDFMNQFSISMRELHNLIILLANENHGIDNDENNLKMKSSEKIIFDILPRRNMYSDGQEKNYEQLTYNQQIELQIENETLKKKVQNLEQLQNVNVNLREKLKSTYSRIHDLENENKSLRKEAAKYQFALNYAKNFRISENNPNNISQLTRDIEDLKHLLENFCSLKKVNINYTAFKDLLKKYDCSSAGDKPSRTLLKGILQRHIIDMVIEYANKYLKIDDENEKFLKTNENQKEQALETVLISTTKKLLKYIDLFSTKRIGKDEVTKSAPIKLRQLVYSVLRNRGFSETLNEGEHQFIIELRDFVVDDLNQYRTIKYPQKNDEIKSTATELICQIISIFCFRRYVQEPIVEYKWFKNSDKVELKFMECSLWEDELDKIMVDICHFPLFGTNLELEKCQVITRASVVQTDVYSKFE
ncbi:hypothetical protein F8M41_023757 [Gigaspora margarita]|uniref:Uncharacterized protein n=1 Tax=Gigaspora margarita TaxID=4874 RepID=A0A8H4EGF2_GIGMA|nr:hypothetical protein F8M41_023757 [Gigaspora margarita]